MLSYRQPINNQLLAYIYKFVYSIASFTFLLATLSTLPVLEEDQLLTAYIFFLRLSAVFMSAAEVIELGVDPVPKWSVPLCFVALAGNTLYIFSTVVYDDFNNGELYIIAMFCTTFAMQLKILCIILQDSRTKQHFLQSQKRRLTKIGTLLVGTIVFLISTVLQQLQVLQDQDYRAGVMNVFGGCMFAASACFVFQKQEHIGYATLDQSLQIPTIL